MKLINNYQKKIVHTMLSKIGMNDDEYRALLYSSFSVDSCKGLLFYQANQLIHKLECIGIAAGVWEKKEKKGYAARFEDLGRRGGMASPAQLRMIEAMWCEKSFMPTLKAKQKALNVFLNNKFGIARIEWITDDMVRNIVKAIKGMKKKGTERTRTGTDGHTEEVYKGKADGKDTKKEDG